MAKKKMFTSGLIGLLGSPKPKRKTKKKTTTKRKPFAKKPTTKRIKHKDDEMIFGKPFNRYPPQPKGIKNKLKAKIKVKRAYRKSMKEYKKQHKKQYATDPEYRAFMDEQSQLDNLY